MHARQVLEIYDRHRDGAPTMVSSGHISTMLYQIGHRDGTMYFTAMTYTVAASVGVALARPDQKVVAIEGDGSMLMGLANYATIGRYQPRNLVIVVINNGVYRSTDRGELETASHYRANLAGFPPVAGIERTLEASTPEEFERAIRQAMVEAGPFVIVANVDHTILMDEGAKEQPDRTELALAYQRYLREMRPAPADGGASAADYDVSQIPQSPGFGRAAGRVIYQAMKKYGVNFVVYLPESILYSVQELAERDPTMQTICCTREDEGISIACGAALAGRSSAIVMEGSGTGLSGLVLAGAIVRRTPVLIVSSYTEILGVRAPFSTISCMVNEPILRALHIPVVELTRLGDTDLIIREAQRSARVTKSPVAVVVPPYLMDEVPA